MDQRMKYSYAAVCATGRVRTENQDRIYLNGTICGGGYAQTDGTGRKQGLFAVADGMGGQAQGAQAAQAALEALPPKKCWSPEAVLQAYDAGNRAICDQIGKIGKRSGATLTTLLLADGEAYAANIGDSRCYLYRDGCLSRLSEDHTAVQRLIVLGCVAVSFAASWLCTVLPYVKTLSEGTRTILLTILIASAAALLFPVKDAPEQKEGSQDER